jgi:hypothetical protein
MNTKTLVVSHALVAVVCLCIGYFLNGMIDTEAPANFQETQHLAKTTQVQLESSSQPNKPHQIQQIASVTNQRSKDPQDPVDGDGTFPVENGDDDSSRTQTQKEKLATFRKLMQDPEVQKAMMEESRKINQDPEMQRAQRERQEMNAKYLYGELFGKLDLTDEQRGEFIQLWSDGQMAEMDVMMSARLAGSDGEFEDDAPSGVQSRLELIQQQTRQKLNALLGTDFEVYADYAETAQERSALTKLSAVSQEPMDDYTMEALLGIIREEKAAVGTPAPYYGMDLEVAVAMQKDRFERMTIQDAKVTERATSYLTEGQHADLVEYLKALRTQSESGIKMMSAMLEEQQQEEDRNE